MPPPPEDRKTLPHDPSRWKQGDWDFDPDRDEPWEDPKIWRRHIGTPEELEAVADAIVREYEITNIDTDGEVRVIVGMVGERDMPRSWRFGIGEHVAIENLLAIILAVQTHPAVALAKVETEVVNNRHLRVGRRWITAKDGCEIPTIAAPTTLHVWHAVVCRTALAKETYWNRTIGCALRLAVRFVAEASFAGAIFADNAVFEYSHFDGDAIFRDARFTASVRFKCVRFAGFSSFSSARFTRPTRFENALFLDAASFDGACFAEHASFDKARFLADAQFQSTHFDSAWFGGVRFSGRTSFSGARFASNVFFFHCRFHAGTSFAAARFSESVWFNNARFAAGSKLVSALAARHRSTVTKQGNVEHVLGYEGDADGTMKFEQTEFGGTVSFLGVRVWDGTTLEFVGARFARQVNFDDPGPFDRTAKRYRGSRQLPMVRGSIQFAGATLDERLTFEKVRFGPNARLCFHRFLARGGATVELTAEQLRLAPPWPHGNPLARVAVTTAHWLGLIRPASLMRGGDSDNPKEIEKAAGDYELLAANYARQPAKDDLEDDCRWMAHELRRWAMRIDAWNRVVSNLPHLRHAGPLPLPRHIFEWLWLCLVLLAVAVRHCILSAGWFVEHIIGRWLIQRTLVGYLLQMHRIIVTGFLLLTVCAVVYGVWASEDTLSFNHQDLTVPDGFKDRAIFGIFFSLTTFVTLGYGDYAPTGWFKLVTGLEAFFGVTLLALFTVAWGRKMVR